MKQDIGLDNAGAEAANLGFASDGDQFLTFTLDQEEYGIDILRVQEIKGISHITPIPNSPSYLRGAMNLRGTVVPVVDLRIKFGMDEAAYSQHTVVIVVMMGERIIGLVVDAVSDVLNLGAENLESVPSFGSDCDTSFLAGMAKSGERLITLLEIDKLFDFSDAAVAAS